MRALGAARPAKKGQAWVRPSRCDGLSADRQTIGRCVIRWAMAARTILEQAYDLARSGQYRGADDIRLALRSDGFSAMDINMQISGRELVRSLNRICKTARLNTRPSTPNAP